MKGGRNESKEERGEIYQRCIYLHVEKEEVWEREREAYIHMERERESGRVIPVIRRLTRRERGRGRGRPEMHTFPRKEGGS